ncbi:MAG: hypothetical protein GY953_25685, partial [bacterium]|nr:hypothetical protein [bacterium]
MTFNLINRRAHLYLAMFFLPWFFMYGISSIPFSHNQYFNDLYDDGVPQWTTLVDKPFQIEVADDADLDEIGAKIVAGSGFEGAFGTYRSGPDKINVYMFDFWTAKRLTYYVEEGRLLAEDRRFRWDRVLTGMHARGGVKQERSLHDAWAVIVDI